MKYEPPCDCSAGGKGAGNRGGDVSVLSIKTGGPEAAVLLGRAGRKKVCRGVFKLLFENFLVAPGAARRAKGPVVCEAERRGADQISRRPRGRGFKAFRSGPRLWLSPIRDEADRHDGSGLTPGIRFDGCRRHQRSLLLRPLALLLFEVLADSHGEAFRRRRPLCRFGRNARCKRTMMAERWRRASGGGAAREVEETLPEGIDRVDAR
ncbi:hypothetical protein KM043_003939 [Ampulex compressa]|nr:hypothetical protein KM043_003939 [Ampulex compressa]